MLPPDKRGRWPSESHSSKESSRPISNEKQAVAPSLPLGELFGQMWLLAQMCAKIGWLAGWLGDDGGGSQNQQGFHKLHLKDRNIGVSLSFSWALITHRGATRTEENPRVAPMSAKLTPTRLSDGAKGLCNGDHQCVCLRGVLTD